VSKRSDSIDEDQHRFDRLFETTYDSIYRYCLRRVDSSDAEDCAADVFAVAWRRRLQMPGDESQVAWLFAVAYRVIGNQYRARRRRANLRLRLTSMSKTTQENSADHGHDTEPILNALGHLSGSDQELLRLSAWDGLGREEIATVLGINENAVDQRLHRARARLRARLEALGRAPLHTGDEEASS
jgi:RNA polymerase sigma-70 factor (ECF subfamily)